MDIHRSARRHGVADEDIECALVNALMELEIDEDPTKVLVIGPDRATNLLEVVVVMQDDRLKVIHAMPLRRRYRDLLPQSDSDA